MATFKEFLNLEILAGTITKCEPFAKAIKPAYKLWVDFGDKLGIKRSSAQITELYNPDDLIGTQVLAVVNFPQKQIADFISEVLVLGVYTDKGVVLIKPERPVNNGDKLG